MQITMIRHGKTKGNLERRYVGRTDEALLPEELLRLSSCAFAYEDRPDRIYVSPMKRCLQTAQMLYPGCPLTWWPDFRETDFGDFEYKNYQELKDLADYQAWIDSGGQLAFPHGESGEDFRRRCCRAFQTCLADARERGAKKIALVVHGGTIMSILHHFYMEENDFYDWQVGNGEGYILQVEGEKILSAEKLQEKASEDWLS